MQKASFPPKDPSLLLSQRHTIYFYHSSKYQLSAALKVSHSLLDCKQTQTAAEGWITLWILKLNKSIRYGKKTNKQTTAEKLHIITNKSLVDREFFSDTEVPSTVSAGIS